MYLGSTRGLERTLVPADIRTCFLPMAPPTSPRGILLLAVATLRALLLLRRQRVRVTFATGGYVSVPAATASWLLRIPVILFLPDVVPGKAARWIVPLARRIAVATTASLPYLPAGKSTVTGYPVRLAFNRITHQQGREHFGLPPAVGVICVLGASLGSRAINQALAGSLPRLLERWHVLHVAGRDRFAEAEQAAAALPAAARARYHLVPFLEEEEMAAAMAAADLVVTRGGASILGELPAVGVPGIIVPLPLAHVHQRENADYLAAQGAAVVLPNDELDRLGSVIATVMTDPERRERMAAAARALARPDAARSIAALVEECA